MSDSKSMRTTEPAYPILQYVHPVQARSNNGGVLVIETAEGKSMLDSLDSPVRVNPNYE